MLEQPAPSVGLGEACTHLWHGRLLPHGSTPPVCSSAATAALSMRCAMRGAQDVGAVGA